MVEALLIVICAKACWWIVNVGKKQLRNASLTVWTIGYLAVTLMILVDGYSSLT